MGCYNSFLIRQDPENIAAQDNQSTGRYITEASSNIGVQLSEMKNEEEVPKEKKVKAVFSRKPWKADVPMTLRELKREKDAFWDTAPKYDVKLISDIREGLKFGRHCRQPVRQRMTGYQMLF